MKKIYQLKEINETARWFLSAIKDAKIIAFYGAMGAGKTSFIKAIGQELGLDPDEVNSPTFALVNEYALPTSGEVCYHFDFYRINTPQEALDFGLYDYFDSGSFCFMEWPEEIEALLPEDTLRVKLEEIEGGKRCLEILD